MKQDHDIEQLLKSLEPTAPREDLEARIGENLDRPREDAEPGKAVRFWRRHQAQILAAAAIATLVLGLWMFSRDPADPVEGMQGQEMAQEPTPYEAPASEEGVYRPVRALNTLKAVEEEGVVLGDNNLPMQQYRYHYVDTVEWRNSLDGSTIQMSYPREEIVRVPVQTL